MGSITDFLELELLDHCLNSASYTPPGTVWIGLATADPTDAATGAAFNEAANTGSYARKAITFGAAASRSIAQNADVTFDTATGSWGTITHYALLDSATYGAGNALAHGSLSATKVVISGNTPKVVSGVVTVSFNANEISDYLSNKLLDHAFRNTAYTVPGTTWVGLATASISDATTGTNVGEVTGSGYARKQVNVNGGAAPTWDLAAAGVVDNGGTIMIGTASASWGTVTGTFVVDASTNGNMLFYDNAMTDQAVGVDDSVYFDPGAYDIELS